MRSTPTHTPCAALRAAPMGNIALFLSFVLSVAMLCATTQANARIIHKERSLYRTCLLYTSDAADE